MSRVLLKVQLGPIKEFISQARSTRDLWSGSYLLAWLMGRGAWALVQASGGDPGAVLSPVLAGQPIFDFHADPTRGRDAPLDDLLTPNFTNILVAQLPADRVVPAVEALVAAICDERDAIARACWGRLLRAGLVDTGAEPRFRSQVRTFPTIAWQATAQPPAAGLAAWLAPVPMTPALRSKLLSSRSDFPAQVARNSWELDAVRALRTFGGWESGSGTGERDSLNGRDAALLGGAEWWDSHFEAVDNATSPIRRRIRLRPLPGRARPNDLWPILFRERQKDDRLGGIQIVKRLWHWAYLAEQRNLDATHRREPEGKHYPFPSTAHLAVHDPAKNLDENTDELLDSMRAELAADRHSRYFAVLAVDGDKMGEWLGGERSDEGPTEAFRRDLSGRLSHFALYCVRAIVEACDGRLVLAGGEDVLALLPADTALDCARLLRLAYRGDPALIQPLAELAERLRRHHLAHEYEEPPDHDAKRPEMSALLVAAARGTLFALGAKAGELVFNPSLASAGSPEHTAAAKALALPGGVPRSAGIDAPDLSAGVAIAHYKEPLQDVVEAAWQAQARAKNELGRGAVSVTLVKHSGETIRWGCKWESGGLELLDCLQRGRATQVFSARFPHRLVEILVPYLGADTPVTAHGLASVAGFAERQSAIVEREFAGVVQRQRGDASDVDRGRFLKATDPAAKLKVFLDGLAAQGIRGRSAMESLVGLCQVAAFVEPAVHSPGFLETER